MKERLPKHRPFMVIYDENKCVSWMTKREMEEKVLQGEVNHIRGQDNINEFELLVYKAKLVIEGIQEKQVANNKEIAEFINFSSEEPISRNAVARARRRLAHKLGFKKGW